MPSSVGPLPIDPPRIISRNNVSVSGTGTQAMLFAHGFGCDQNMWRYVAPAFESDMRNILFDYVGAGRSEIAAYDRHRYSTLHGYATDVLEICEALNLTDVVFVGHSVSAMIGALAAIREPHRFSQLILLAPSPRYLNDLPAYEGGFEREEIDGLLGMMEKNYLGWASMLAPLAMGREGEPELTADLERSFCATDPSIARQFAEVTFLSDTRIELGKVTVPSLILQCAEDALAPEVVGRYLHERLPNSTFHQMAATGHCPHVSHPQETIAAIRAYLSSSSLRS